MTTSTAAQIASVSQQPEPTPPVAGSNKPPSAAENSEQSSSTQSSESTVRSKKKTVASNRTSTSRSARINRALPYEDEYGRGPNYQGRPHVARVIGNTPDGRMIVRLSSGRIVTLPRLNDDDIYTPRPRRRVPGERPDDFVPPSQPFYAPDYPND